MTDSQLQRLEIVELIAKRVIMLLTPEERAELSKEIGFIRYEYREGLKGNK